QVAQLLLAGDSGGVRQDGDDFFGRLPVLERDPQRLGQQEEIALHAAFLTRALEPVCPASYTDPCARQADPRCAQPDRQRLRFGLFPSFGRRIVPNRTAATRRKSPAQDPRKLATGIAGFDAMSGGGLPRHRTSLLIGGPGAGKTVFALQCLVNGARRRAPGIFVAFEESPAQLIANASSFDWRLGSLPARQL